VFLFIDSVLFGVPFKPHRYTQCITVMAIDQTGTAVEPPGRMTILVLETMGFEEPVLFRPNSERLFC
jgi:hypothetical protein